MEEEFTLGENKIYTKRYIPDNKTFDNTLVFVHGSFGGYWMWNMIVHTLVGLGFECITFSLRGHKPSSGELKDSGMQNYADDISSVVKQMKLQNPVVVGHSMSGLVVLMYASQNPVQAVISIDPSPSFEVQGAGDEDEISKIPEVYTAVDAGMPTELMDVMKTFPDMSQEMLMKIKNMLGPESGAARRERKRGISVAKNSINIPLLFIGAEFGDSVKFGISFEKTKKMSEYYDGELFEIKDATHPGILVGKHAQKTANKISEWLKEL